MYRQELEAEQLQRAVAARSSGVSYFGIAQSGHALAPRSLDTEARFILASHPRALGIRNPDFQAPLGVVLVYQLSCSGVTRWVSIVV